MCGVATSDAPMTYQQRAVPCDTQTAKCQKCLIDPKYTYCMVEKYIDDCGILRILGIVVACIIPTCALVGIPTIFSNSVSSVGWNILMGITYL